MKREVIVVNVLFPLVKELFKQLNDAGFIQCHQKSETESQSD